MKLLKDFNFELKIGGSWAEGVPLNSDTDVLMIYRDVICVEEGHEEAGLTVFETDMANCPAWHTQLSVRHFECGNSFGLVNSASTILKRTNAGEKHYVSSLKFLNMNITYSFYAGKFCSRPCHNNKQGLKRPCHVIHSDYTQSM